MGDCISVRALLMLLALVSYLIALTFNILALFGPWTGAFMQTTQYVLSKSTTHLTPDRWVLFLWDVLNIWLIGMFIYLIHNLRRREAYTWMYTTPAVLPYGFYLSWIVNSMLNMAWLFLYDKDFCVCHRKMVPTLLITALQAISNCVIIMFSCCGLVVYGAWLHKYHNNDLWLIRILVQNGVALYATWWAVATFLHLTVVLDHQTPIPKTDAAIMVLVLLQLGLIGWFVIENWYLDKHVRYILTVYPVVILVLAASVANPATPGTHIDIMSAVILAITSVIFIVRIIMVLWKHKHQPLYGEEELRSPVDIARTQKLIFM
ncbi:uncharacterized protein LOC115130404 isoform X1 [Oncorhynchus nerka]|uniref:uncharacterized protein LOC109899514 isoform X1 n=2 Tax=Oncorhynchus kisutch TaxID=8019 RepID=UPI00099F8048|nr:uncharacterized protein LOC109899514 isoform X1 [Oncorhynchus kisutch]XP_021418692.1 uncharacterized protein LOC110489977 isoform X1 [Oncorhynchus mykiss]XP_024248863.1 uncharacterized protein LOC112228001 isoform X1 [Oncorhynchus tshawytscha]XP_029517389.1 uncharacterized protein LOC115130404 isoform X1 [Oncorhynchus nerka]XP_046211054.1 uncharacterized protein LOC124039188 isoform X1 [Oncorhynchus gorbuscha]